jgi:protease I
MIMLTGLRFAVFVERDTNPTEFNYIRLRLIEAGAAVTVIGLDRLEYRLEDHSTGYADSLIDDVTGQAFDGVVIPGGLGPEKLRLNEKVIQLVQDCHARGKLCAAICHGQLVLISAGLMRGVRATAAWSMMDDLRMVGAIVPEGVRAVRDGQFVTAIFPRDLPAFFQLIFTALVELEKLTLPDGYPQRLAGQTWGMVVDNFSDATQLYYLKLRIEEEGGTALLLGRQARQEIRLGSPTYEWGELGLRTEVEQALPDVGVIGSCDNAAESNSGAITAEQLDGLLLPGGLATWMIREHPGMRQLIQAINAQGKPIGAIERGSKLLFMTGVLDGRTITCSPYMQDDIIHAVTPVEYQDAPVVQDGNLLTAQGTEDLPLFMRTLIEQFGKR